MYYFFTFLASAVILGVTASVETDIDPISKLIDTGTTGLLLYFGGQHLIKAMNGIGGRIDRLKEHIEDLERQIARLEVFMENSRYQSNSGFSRKYLDSQNDYE